MIGSILSAGLTHAAVLFSGMDGSLDFGTSSGSYTLSDITVTLSANDGIVNATSSGLGINDSATGDDTDGIDTINIIESLTMSFNVDVVFNNLVLNAIGTNDGLSVSFNSGPPTLITTSSTTVFNTSLMAGDTVTFTAFEPNLGASNNGVRITSFEVTAIPEPFSAVLLGLGGVALLFQRRRL